MAERLVILSDLWGTKKGLWITSYLGYLQQYFDIVFHDTQQLADVDLVVCTPENLHEAFTNGGMDTAMAHLLTKEDQPSHYLAFCAGGTVVWNAALKGLPIKSLYAVSPLDLHLVDQKPDCPVRLLFGENEKIMPDQEWANRLGVSMEVMPNYGHELYSDEIIIQKICLQLLDSAINKKFQL